MKIEVNLEKRYFFSLMLMGLVVIGFVGVYAYNSAGVPAVMGHSVNEIDWKQKISGNISADGICIGTDCRTAWSNVTGGGGGGNVTRIIAGSGIVISPVGGTGVVMINSTATGGGGGGTDTRCDAARVCSRICIGNECITDVKAKAVYIQHSRCSNVDDLTTSSTCSTMRCYSTHYYACNGNCDKHSGVSCSNTLAGYLVK